MPAMPPQLTPAPAPNIPTSAAPIRKVALGGLAGAITVIIVYLVAQFGHVAIDPTVSGALTTLITIVTAYLVPSADTTATPTN